MHLSSEVIEFLLPSESSRTALKFWRIYFLWKQWQNLSARFPKRFHTSGFWREWRDNWNWNHYLGKQILLLVCMWYFCKQQRDKALLIKKNQRAWPLAAHPLGKLPSFLSLAIEFRISHFKCTEFLGEYSIRLKAYSAISFLDCMCLNLYNSSLYLGAEYIQ